MRRKDKLANMKRVNILFEQRVNESPMFGNQKVSQDQHDELQWDKQNLEKASMDAFETPEGYELRNNVEIGGRYTSPDGDDVKVVGETPDGHINIILTFGEESIKQHKKWGIENPKPMKLTWSKVQFDSIMGDMDDYDDSQYHGEVHGY